MLNNKPKLETPISCKNGGQLRTPSTLTSQQEIDILHK